jgi:isopenicillin N synthase-like dioxygenase
MSGDFPVIDIAAVRQPQVSAAARFEIARQVASACEEIGFFAVTGHGVPGAVIADLVAHSYAFFDLPLAEKLAVRRPRPEQKPRLYRAGRGTSGSTARRRNTAGSEGVVHNWSVRYVRDAVLHRAGSVSKLRT